MIAVTQNANSPNDAHAMKMNVSERSLVSTESEEYDKIVAKPKDEKTDLDSIDTDLGNSATSLLTPDGAMLRQAQSSDIAGEVRVSTEERLNRSTASISVFGCIAEEATVDDSSYKQQHPADTLPTMQKSTKRLVHTACQSILTTLRADSRYVAHNRFTEELTLQDVYGHDLYLRLQQVLMKLSLEENVEYLPVFCEAVQRRDISAAATGAVLAALHKFVVSHTLTEVELDRVAQCLVHCTFEETTVVPTSNEAEAISEGFGRRRSQAVGEEAILDDEQVVLKLLHVCICTAKKGASLDAIGTILDTCWHVHHKAAGASPLLQTAAGEAAEQICTSVFTTSPNTQSRVEILAKVTNLLQLCIDQNTRKEYVSRHALNLLNSILELGDLRHEEKEVMEKVATRDILALAIQSDDCNTLQYCCRVWMQLLDSLGLDILKYDFDLFIQSVHLRLLKSLSSTPEQKEVALESLLELCYGGCAPVSIRDIYINYDCDETCSNLYESIIAQLGSTACPANMMNDSSYNQHDGNTVAKAKVEIGGNSLHSTTSNASVLVPTQDDSKKQLARPQKELLLGPPSENMKLAQPAATAKNNMPLNHLNRLGLEGVLTILDSIAQRCRFDGELIVDPSNESSNENVQETEFCSRKRTKTAMQSVAHAFNVGNPDKGDWLRLAVREGLLKSAEDPKEVAELLHRAPEAIDKRRLGIYLSRGPAENFPFHAAVRNSFTTIYDFKGLSFATALRKFLNKFRLPGEAQCIDRLMEVFSKELYRQQGEVSSFKNSDAIFVLAFSTIMLNTDLHNPTIKEGERMTKEQFVKNNRGINGGEDLSKEYLSDLYEHIKGKELRVKQEVSNFIRDNQENYSAAWEDMQAKKDGRSVPVYFSVSHSETYPSPLDREMFLALAKTSVEAISGVYSNSWDDAVVVRTLRGLQQMVKLAVHFNADAVVNEVLCFLLPKGRDYVYSCLTSGLHSQLENSQLASIEPPTQVLDDTVVEPMDNEDETTCGADSDQLIPFGLLCSSEETGNLDITGSASNRGLLALDSSFVLLRKHSTRVADAWPSFIECLCALRDIRALPSALSDLDDFADSSGNVLPASQYANESQKRLDSHLRSLSERDTIKKGWFRFFRKGKNSTSDDEGSVGPKVELSLYAKTLLDVAEAANVEEIVHLGSFQMPGSTIQTLLDSLDRYPFDSSPTEEQHTIFTLELAARALLSNRERGVELFAMFLAKFESVMCKVTEEGEDMIGSPFVVERIVVTILRSSIHLYEYSELRPHLRASLQLLMMLLPKFFISVVSDRMACGLAIILRNSYKYFETQEWAFMADTLDVLANYDSSRVFVFDGIASTVEYAIPKFEQIGIYSERSAGTITAEADRPSLSSEACSGLSRILTRFVLGFYQGDLSLVVPAMFCLEKVYRHRVELLLYDKLTEDEIDSPTLNPMTAVPDKELWQNLAVALYSVCRSPNADVSRSGTECYRRFLLQTDLKQVPDDKWIAIMYLMVNKQPPLMSESSRGNTFSILGQILTRLLPTLSHRGENREDLEDLLTQYASLAEENLQQARGQGGLFEKTLQTLTYISNHMVSDEWAGEKSFSTWASEILLKELERMGEIAVGGKADRKPITTARAEEVHDVSEISESGGEEDSM